MKHFVCIGALLILLSTAVQAETMYISDLAEITLRTGKGIDHKIIAMVNSGTQVEVLEPDDQWTKVRLPSGREGWMVSRFLTAKIPSSIALKELKKKYEALLALADSPYKEITKLQEENQKLSSELSFSNKALSELAESYEALKSESAKLSKVQAGYQNSTSQLAEQQQKIAKLEAAMSKLEMRHHIRWFLSGAAVLFVGFLMGFSTKQKRRRPSLL